MRSANYAVYIWILLHLAMAAKAEQTIIPIEVQGSQHDSQYAYFLDLLKMALETSKAKNEVFEVKYNVRNNSQARWISILQKTTNNSVIWTMSDAEREEQLRPIRIPLSKGLFGYRVLVIREGEQKRFDQINNISDLAEFIGGQGIHWPDTRIMKANGLRLITAESTESLFNMIQAKRFDYFPRGALEAWLELSNRPDEKLVVEENLLIYYPADVYFFVNKNNEALAKRIESGLETMIDNGQFDKFFHSNPTVIAILNKLHGRRLLTLNNPYLSTGTPVNNPRYWIDLSTLNLQQATQKN